MPYSMASFLKPPLTRLLKSIPPEALDRRLSEKELSVIARQILDWQDKAITLGLSDSEIEDIHEDHKNSNQMQKVAMMRRWAEVNGDQATLRELIKISRRNHWYYFIHKVCKDLGYTKQEKSFLEKGIINFVRSHFFYFLVSVMVLLVSILTYGFMRTPTSNQISSLPYPVQNFIGRHEEIEELLIHLQFQADKPRIVSITGSPGFGKSTLAINIGHKLITKEVSVIYINMNDITNVQALVKRILKESGSGRMAVEQDLYLWSKNLKCQTLLVLDDCDEQFHTKKDDLQRVIKGLVKESSPKKLKILTTSREQVMYIQDYKVYVLKELTASHASELLLHITDSLDTATREDIANLTGGVPLALRVVGGLLNMPDSQTPQQILSQLRDNLIGTLSPEELLTEDRVNASIYLSYQYLQNDMQKLGRYLSHFPGSFDANVVAEIIEKINTLPDTDIRGSLNLFVRRSLMNYKQGNRYTYHKLIREFFRNVLLSTEESEEFNMSFLEYYTSILIKMENEHSVNAVKRFYTDGHNFKYFFDQLNVNKDSEKVAKTVAKTLMKVADTIGNFSNFNHVLYYQFTSQEIQTYIRNFLSHLKHIDWDLIRFFNKDQFIQVYSKLAVHLIMFEKSFITNTTILINSMKEYHGIFEKNAQSISTEIYITFYSTLAKHYENLDDHKRAKNYHEKVLRRVKLLDGCHEECSNIAMANAFSFIEDFERRDYYLDKELTIIRKMSLLNFGDVVTMADKLIEVFNIKKCSDSSESSDPYCDEVVTKLAEIMDLHELTVFQKYYTDTIIKTSYLLQSMNRIADSQKLKNRFKHAVISNYNGYLSSVSQFMDDQFFTQKNHEMVILIGESVLKATIKQENDHVLAYRMYYMLGSSLYLSGNYTGSSVYYSDLVKLETSAGLMEHSLHACSRLIIMVSPNLKCIMLFPSLLWYNANVTFHHLYKLSSTLSKPQFPLTVMKSLYFISPDLTTTDSETGLTRYESVSKNSKTHVHSNNIGDNFNSQIIHAALRIMGAMLIYLFYCPITCIHLIKIIINLVSLLSNNNNIITIRDLFRLIIFGSVKIMLLAVALLCLLVHYTEGLIMNDVIKICAIVIILSFISVLYFIIHVVITM